MISSNPASAGDDKLASDVKGNMVSGNHIHSEKVENKQRNFQQQNCDILLNTFQIKKKRYKVLLNCDHIVWERLESKHSSASKNARHSEKTPASALPVVNEAAAQKEAEYEREQLSQRATYGSLSNVVHLREVVRVAKGSSKSATVRNAYQTLEQPTREAQGHATPTPTDQYLSVYYAERIVASSTDCNRWHIRRLTLHNNDPYIVAKWYENLQSLLQRYSETRVKRLLVFINPYGGRKMGLQIFERSCKPTIQLAGIDASCIITQRANQIRDILMSHDLTPFDAVCCVGGDGTVAEMINGLILRAMQDRNVCLRKPDDIPKPHLPIAIIPAGSTDAIVYSLHGTSDAQTATIHMVLGQRRGLDVCSIRNNDGIIRFCASAMGYGYLGDVAAKSEQYRWMGTKRYEYTGVKAFLSNRGYEAEVKMLLKDDETKGTLSPSQGELICHANCETCRKLASNDIDADKPSSSHSSLHLQHKMETKSTIDNEHSRNLDRNDSDKDYSNKPMEKQTQIKALIKEDYDDVITSDQERPISPSSTSTSSDNAQQPQYLQVAASDSQFGNNVPKWRIIRGEFFMITATNITCACTRSPNGMSKYCHLGDGHLDVVLVRKTNLLNNVRFVINTMGRNGDIRNLPFIEVYRTKQFIFKAKPNITPQDYNSIRGSCQPIADSYAEADANRPEGLYSSWNCDGEVINDLEITITSHRQLIDVFMRGPYIYSKPSLNNSDNKSIFCCCHSDT
ncbi:ceramide kinase isoform X1 [Stomoxys calcitrans]|uniref:ceramide kinase isoform X1 n=1 Tax=Stomoxys calcitrans TaxID=35570 RepID=UPI0027E33995|nr:ceramide kinase isoform X1 [Stomoxys calcitrans]XP_059218431.1 ceramide kinase isoform X1 [Stomoxys calcitrans]